MTYTVTLIPGDGVGPEVTEAARRVLEATGVKFKWDIVEVGSYAMEKYGTPLPPSVIISVKKNKVALKGPVTTPVGSGFRSVNVALRKELELFVCLRPCKTYPGVPSRYQNIDLVIVREIWKTFMPVLNLNGGLLEQQGLSNIFLMLTKVSYALTPVLVLNPSLNSAVNASLNLPLNMLKPIIGKGHGCS